MNNLNIAKTLSGCVAREAVVVQQYPETELDLHTLETESNSDK